MLCVRGPLKLVAEGGYSDATAIRLALHDADAGYLANASQRSVNHGI